MAILRSLESTSFDENNRCASKWFILKFKKTPQNLELVILKYVTYA